MKFLLDECCRSQLVDKLRAAGHDVLYVLEESPGATDTEVLQKARREDRILITEDKDFGELVFRLRKDVRGIILLRFSAKERQLQWAHLDELINLKGLELRNKFAVVDSEKFRIRPLN